MKMFMTIAFILVAQSSFAGSRPASKSEVKMLCRGVERMFEREFVDAAVDLQRCFKARMHVRYDFEGTTIVGKVPVNTPNRSLTQTCQGVVRGKVVKLVSCI